MRVRPINMKSTLSVGSTCPDTVTVCHISTEIQGSISNILAKFQGVPALREIQEVPASH